MAWARTIDRKVLRHWGWLWGIASAKKKRQQEQDSALSLELISPPLRALHLPHAEQEWGGVGRRGVGPKQGMKASLVGRQCGASEPELGAPGMGVKHSQAQPPHPKPTLRATLGGICDPLIPSPHPQTEICVKGRRRSLGTLGLTALGDSPEKGSSTPNPLSQPGINATSIYWKPTPVQSAGSTGLWRYKTSSHPGQVRETDG